MKRMIGSNAGLVLLGTLWLAAIGLGAVRMLEYEGAPGRAANAPEQWPVGSRVPRPAGVATLVMLAHPRCPCMRASLSELALLMTRRQGRVKAFVLFSRPAGIPERWVQTDLWDSAARLPGVTVMRDDGGVETRRFGAFTAGQTLLYDAQGRLRFGGGLTDGRGRAGNNPGLEALDALLGGSAGPRVTFPVFGCALRNPADVQSER